MENKGNVKKLRSVNSLLQMIQEQDPATEVTEYLIRYVFISEEEAAFSSLVKNTVRRAVEELLFLKPLRTRIVSVVTNHPGAYDDLCTCRDQMSYNGELVVLLFVQKR